MKILVLNSGSSTLKLDFLDVASATDQPKELAQGVVDHIGTPDASLSFDVQGKKIEERVGAGGYGSALTQALDALRAGIGDHVDAVGHRVVHGGDRFVAPTLLDDKSIASLDALSELAPLHNPPAVEVIRAAHGAFPETPMVAVFDTAFHSGLAAEAYTYALPHDLADRYQIRRYGFHGIAHQFMLERYCGITSTTADEATIITLQLGNGCSACAIRSGRSVDTSMGFTPLEGLVMGTRSGDLDPGVVAYLAEKEKKSAEEIVTILNKRSGLLGVSNSTSDMRALLASREREPLADLAIEVFAYRVRKYIGAYMNVLGGAKAVVFGGGIGEHSAYVRARILANMEWCGLQLDGELNERATGAEARITGEQSRVAGYVIPVEESVLIARQTYGLLTGR